MLLTLSARWWASPSPQTSNGLQAIRKPRRAGCSFLLGSWRHPWKWEVTEPCPARSRLRCQTIPGVHHHDSIKHLGNGKCTSLNTALFSYIKARRCLRISSLEGFDGITFSASHSIYFKNLQFLSAFNDPSGTKSFISFPAFWRLV